ncbi:MAG: RecX family transcriptional regulator, partial [Chryseobacterium sp.]|nr:RecX family transcriptional regulator [Candidatus Chryseobacterium enterohippi]
MQREKKLYTFEEIRQKVVNYCVYQDRCHAEVEQKMREFVLIPEAKEEIMLFLLRENFLNEERFTRSYIRGKFYMKNWGKIKIKLNLIKKDISEKSISKCMDEIDEDDYYKTLKKLYDSYHMKLSGMKDYQKKANTIKHLLGKGYSY